MKLDSVGPWPGRYQRQLLRSNCRWRTHAGAGKAKVAWAQRKGRCEGGRRAGARTSQIANFSLHRARLGPCHLRHEQLCRYPYPLSCKDAGVDIDAGDALVERIKPLAKKTMREGVLAGIGGFGALFEVPKRYKEPVGQRHRRRGHQLKLAFEWNMHDTVGIDHRWRA